jgi:hydrogenase maturation factor
MHDATECGVYGGLYEIGRAAGVGIEIERDAVPVLPGVEAACDFFGIDPWKSISEGTLLASVDPDGVDDVLAALDDEGIPAADVGEVTEGSGLVVDGEPTDHPGADPFWAAMAEYAEKLQG